MGSFPPSDSALLAVSSKYEDLGRELNQDENLNLDVFNVFTLPIHKTLFRVVSANTVVKL